MKKIFSLFAALTLCAGLWAAAPANVESVDLGLPSGLKWATFNVGATAPEGNGDYFAWGETEPYYNTPITDPISWKIGKETGYSWQSYCASSSFSEWSTAPYDASTKILKPEFDAATANWGSDWRMPTKAEQDELRTECTWTWTADYNGTGIKGYIVASKAEGNTNSIFLPASGYRVGSPLDYVGYFGCYWSSSLYSSNSRYAYYLEFSPSGANWNFSDRFSGPSVRAVTTKSIVPGPKVGDQFVDATSVLKFEVTAVGEANTVKVIANDYTATSYTVPDTVKYLDVDFAVTEIGESAFRRCYSLSSITLPEGLKTIGERVFEEGFALSAITIPSSVTTIGEQAFNTTGLESITFAEGSQLTTIEAYAFYYSSSLKSIDIPASVTAIGDHAFTNCSALQAVTLPATLKSIGINTFRKCAALTSITLPTALDSIGETAFAQSGLESITIPASVDSIARLAFLACTSLTSIVVESGNTRYDSRDNCNGIVEKATNTLIAACKNTIIPNTVAILGQEVFEMLPITAITIPASVTTIKDGAFMGCSSLAEVTVLWTTADAIPSGDNMRNVVFNGIAAGAKLRVPTGTRALYEAAEVWQDFTIIEEYTPTALPTLFGDGVKANKFLHNGQMIIRKDAKLYNAVGQELR